MIEIGTHPNLRLTYYSCFNPNIVIAFRTTRPVPGFILTRLNKKPFSSSRMTQGVSTPVCRAYLSTISSPRKHGGHKRFTQRKSEAGSIKTEPHCRLDLSAAATWYLRIASIGCRLEQEYLEEFYRKRVSEASVAKGFDRSYDGQTTDRCSRKTTKMIRFCHSSFCRDSIPFRSGAKSNGTLFIFQNKKVIFAS